MAAQRRRGWLSHGASGRLRPLEPLVSQPWLLRFLARPPQERVEVFVWAIGAYGLPWFSTSLAHFSECILDCQASPSDKPSGQNLPCATTPG